MPRPEIIRGAADPGFSSGKLKPPGVEKGRPAKVLPEDASQAATVDAGVQVRWGAGGDQTQAREVGLDRGGGDRAGGGGGGGGDGRRVLRDVGGASGPA